MQSTVALSVLFVDKVECAFWQQLDSVCFGHDLIGPDSRVVPHLSKSGPFDPGVAVF